LSEIKIRICEQPSKDGYLCGTPIVDKPCPKEHGTYFKEECRIALKEIGIDV